MLLRRREPARDDDELIRYLLGELAEEEADRLDELSIVDDEFTTRLRMAEEELVDAYVSGRLTGGRRTRFESVYLLSPRRREKAAFARRFLTAVEKAAPAQPAATAPQADRRMIRWLPLSVAAALVLLAATGWLAVRDRQLRATLRETQASLAEAGRQTAALSTELANQQRAAAAAQESLAHAQTHAQTAQPSSTVAIVLMPMTRGVGAVPIVAVGPESDTVPIALAVAGPDRSPYVAELRDPATNAVVWRSGPLALARTRLAPLLTVHVLASALKSQHYLLDVHVRGGGDIGSYAFEVARQ